MKPFQVLLLLLGVFACSTAVIMIKASTVDPVYLAALRLLLAGALLSPLAWRDWRRMKLRQYAHPWRQSVWPGLLLALHFISWIIGARMAPAANSSLIVNLVPIAMPFILVLILQERLTKREWIGTGVALIGLFLLTGTDFNISETYFWGDLICLGSMLLFAVYLVLGRKNKSLPSIWLYLVPLYLTGGLFCLLISLFRVDLFTPLPARELALVIGLAVLPTVVGHSLLNHAMKVFRGQVVGVVNLGQFIFAGGMGYLFFHEVPPLAFYAASALLVASAGYILREKA